MAESVVIPALNQLTTDLEAIFTKHPDCQDSDVIDHVCGVLQSILIEGNLEAKIPIFYGVFNPGVNLKIRGALARFVATQACREFVEQVGETERVEILKTALQNDQIRSQSGTPMTEVLGEWV